MVKKHSQTGGKPCSAKRTGKRLGGMCYTDSSRRLAKAATAGLFTLVSIIEVHRWDWDFPQSVCLRLWPVQKPKCFLRRIWMFNGG